MNLESLKVDFQKIIDRVELPDYLIYISKKITTGDISIQEIEKTLVEYNVHHNVAKLDFINFIFEYIKISFEDNILTDEEKIVINYLKRLFQILPGDFMFHSKGTVESVVCFQLSLLYSDNYITPEEAVMKIELQEIFDLSYDQMNGYSKTEAKISIRQGADLKDLDVLFTHLEYFELKKIM